MKKMVVLAVAFVATLAGSAEAQVQTQDYWTSSDACVQAVQSGNFRYYYPDRPRRRPVARNERVAGHPTGGCFLMELPDRAGGRGWVAIEPGRRFVYRDGRVDRLEECNNVIEGFVPFPTSPAPRDGAQGLRGEQGPSGPPGERGPQGPPGVDGRDLTFFQQEPVRRGMPGWLKGLLIGGAAAGVGYAIYTCVKEDGWCKDDDDDDTVVQNVTVGPGFVIVNGTPVRVTLGRGGLTLRF